MIDITVIIPVYNAVSTLHRALAGVLCQSDIMLEVLCVDDHSDDGTYQKLLDIAQKDLRVQALVSPEKGPAAARNHGLELAKGRYVLFIDADDYVQLSLKYFIEKADIENAQILHFGYMMECPEGRHILTRKLEECVFNGGKDVVEYFYRRQYGPSGCYALYRKDFLLGAALQFDTTSHCEDAPFFRNCLMAANKIITSSTIAYHYIRYPVSRSKQWGRVQIQDFCLQLHLANMDVFALADSQQCLVDDLYGFSDVLAAVNDYKCDHWFADFLAEYPVVSAHLVVYGTGSVGRKLMGLLPEVEGQIRFFCDSDESKAGSEVDGIPVIGLPQLKVLNDIDVFIGSSFVNDIYNSLVQAGLKERIQTPGIRAFYQHLIRSKDNDE
ncbi:TPA: glycosyltransferase [Aeromonas veronii]